MVPEALQSTDYVLNTRGTSPPGPAPLGTGAVVGMPSKHDGSRLKQQIHFLLTSIPSACYHVQERLFDASIMLEDSAFRDILSSHYQVELGDGRNAGPNTAEGVLDVHEDI